VLKITMTETPTESRWIRAGMLGGAVGQRTQNNLEEGAQEPGQAGLHYRTSMTSRPSTKAGNDCCGAMSKKGAQLIATVYTSARA